MEVSYLLRKTIHKIGEVLAVILDEVTGAGFLNFCCSKEKSPSATTLSRQIVTFYVTYSYLATQLL